MGFTKRKKDQTEKVLGEILDSQDANILVTRGKDCEILFANAPARERIANEEMAELGCKKGYSRLFPYICEHCRGLDTEQGERVADSSEYDIEDKDKNIYSVQTRTIEWSDDRPATVLFVRDVTEERNVKNKLFNLAYIDQLTGIPNRQRFREDFEAVRAQIEANKLFGAVAIFDLDNFKTINDTYGHNTGDAMLRRLADHMESDDKFKGHIYRLGGDEFVLFYKEPAGKFTSPEDMHAHYSEILNGAFLAYTMPNIEKACTLSMGVAFFPGHGASYSELLRKADIALYNAKEAGRNRLAFFEDQYEMAEKFKDLYINVQPILMASGKTYGYELVDRGESKSEDSDTLSLSGFNRTMDALGLNDMENDARYYINYSKQLLSAPVLKNLPKEKFVIQIYAGNRYSEKELTIFRTLCSHGYALALNGLTTTNGVPALMDIVKYCKFEPGSMSEDRMQVFIKDNPRKMFIAAGVNTQADFEHMRNLGFKLFQGFFFNQQVEVKKTKDIDPLKANYFRLLQMTSTEDYVDFQEISNIISSDVALSYKLLKLLNSAAVGLRHKVSSITMAVAYLGEENLKQWIALLALRGIASDRPLELVRMSLVRAHFGELLAPLMRPKRDEKQVFMVGLLSLLHIALEQPKEQLLEELPVGDDIKESLLTKNGVYSELLSFFSDYEYSNWDEVNRFAKENFLSAEQISDAYVAAVKWGNELTQGS